MGEWQGHHSREPKNGRDPAKFCTDISLRTGKQCRRYKVPGFDYCAVHLARRPRTKLQMLGRMDDCYELTIDEMDRRLRDKERREQILDSDLIRMAGFLADRTGYGPSSTHEVHRTTDLRPRVIDMLTNPPALSPTAVASITTLPAISGNSPSRNKNPKAAKQLK